MRLDKVLRFLVIAFAVGAFIGLICGLAFGGGDGTGTSPVVDETGDGTDVSAGDSTRPSASAGPVTAEVAEAIGSNELGKVLVIVYFDIGSEEDETTRTPDGLRQDLELLESSGYYPISARELVAGDIDVPAGRSPVVITFDGSSPGHYRILDDGSLDPECAVGILQDAAQSDSWAPRASFFCLTDVVPSDNELFGQPDVRREKLRNLVNWGYEVGSHTASNADLSDASAEKVAEELARSQATLEDLIGGGYSVTSLSLPFGKYPQSADSLASGEYDGAAYSYSAVLTLEETPSYSPFSTEFDPLRIPRIKATANGLRKALEAFENHPELRYISDGDPTTVSAPADLADGLGQMREDLGRPVVLY
jgi:peptidoglycan/xylan/chitin deacetylase (PgdA/CDA1 family)